MMHLTRKRGYLVVRAGELYGGLADETVAGPGRGHHEKVVNLVNEVSAKQLAEAEIGKSRPIIAKWVWKAHARLGQLLGPGIPGQHAPPCNVLQGFDEHARYFARQYYEAEQEGRT